MAEVRMDDLKPNSHQYNREVEEKEAEEKKEREQKQLSGTASKRKRSFIKTLGDIFLRDGASPKEIKRYLIEEIIVPTILDSITDTITTAVEMRFFGEAGRISRGSRNKPRSNSTMNYGDYYVGGKNKKPARSNRDVTAFEPLDEFVFDNMADAEQVLIDMQEILEHYPQVTVADYIDILKQYGLPVRDAEHTDNKYGWKDLSNVTARRARGGGYFLDLPREYPV